MFTGTLCFRYIYSLSDHVSPSSCCILPTVRIPVQGDHSPDQEAHRTDPEAAHTDPEEVRTDLGVDHTGPEVTHTVQGVVHRTPAEVHHTDQEEDRRSFEDHRTDQADRRTPAAGILPGVHHTGCPGLRCLGRTAPDSHYSTSLPDLPMVVQSLLDYRDAKDLVRTVPARAGHRSVQTS